MKHTSSMAPRLRRRRARIEIFAAASLEQPNRCQDLLQRTRRSPDDVPANELESREQRRDQQQFAAECVGLTLLHGKWKSKLVERLKPFSEFGDIMDDFSNPPELALQSQ